MKFRRQMSQPSFVRSFVFSLEICVTWLTVLSTAGQSGTERRMAEDRVVTGEYCERESFDATCASDEVILMRTALYGRMQFGKCVRTEYGGLGCSADVLRVVDSWCSGRRQCVFPVTDLHSSTTCPRELIAYLEASYECIPVLQCPETPCSPGDTAKAPSSGGPVDGFLSSGVTSTAGCGSAACPWLVRAKPGQRLNITFYSFVVLSDLQHQGKLCQRLASIVDPATHLSKDVTVCNRDTRVVSHQTASDAAEVKIYPGNPMKPANFVVHYQAFGCPDFEAPIGGWTKRDNNLITVGCNDKQRTWHLTCDGLTWVGQVGDCDQTDVTPSWGVQSALERVKSTTEGILMVIGLGILIGVVTGCSMLTIVVIVIKRRRRRMALQYDCRREALYSEDAATILGDQLYAHKQQQQQQQQQPCANKDFSFEATPNYDAADYNRAFYDRHGADVCATRGGFSYLCPSHRQQDISGPTTTKPGAGQTGPTAAVNFTPDSGKEHAYETPNFST